MVAMLSLFALKSEYLIIALKKIATLIVSMRFLFLSEHLKRRATKTTTPMIRTSRKKRTVIKMNVGPIIWLESFDPSLSSPTPWLIPDAEASVYGSKPSKSPNHRPIGISSKNSARTILLSSLKKIRSTRGNSIYHRLM